MDGMYQRSAWRNTKQNNLSYVVIILVAINVLVHLYGMFVDSSFITKGELQLSRVVVHKEYYRIITGMFLHADVSHIFNNMFVLFFLGDMMEKEIGHIPLGVIYLLSGIGGNLASLFQKAVTHSSIPSVGASGAIFGLDGLLLALVLFSGRRMKNVTLPRTILMIILSVYSGYTSGNTDNAAHIGGLITGFVIGTIYFLAVSLYKKRRGEAL